MTQDRSKTELQGDATVFVDTRSGSSRTPEEWAAEKFRAQTLADILSPAVIIPGIIALIGLLVIMVATPHGRLSAVGLTCFEVGLLVALLRMAFWKARSF